MSEHYPLGAFNIFCLFTKGLIDILKYYSFEFKLSTLSCYRALKIEGKCLILFLKETGILNS